MTNKYITEFIATFALIFFGTGTIILNDTTGGAITSVGISIVFGLAVAILIYLFADVSGAHINPAVTLGFWSSGQLENKDLLPYIAAQFSGGILASLLLSFLFPNNLNLGATLTVLPDMQTLAVEISITFILMSVMLGVTANTNLKGFTPGLIIGSVVTLAALFIGPLTGASMNPARSLAPALVSGNLSSIWIYLIGPTIGTLLSVFTCRCVRGRGCCGVPGVMRDK